MSLLVIFGGLLFSCGVFAGGVKLLADLYRLRDVELNELIQNRNVRFSVRTVGSVTLAATLLYFYVSSRGAQDSGVPTVSSSTAVTVLPWNSTALPRPAAMEPCPVGPRFASLASDLEACLDRSGCLGSARICLGLSKALPFSPSVGEPCEVVVGRRLPLDETRLIADRLRAGSCWRESFSWLAEIPGVDGENTRLNWLKLACSRTPGIVTDGRLSGFNLPRDNCG